MTRRVTIRTRHDDAESVAAAVEPDNTTEMETAVEADDGPSDGTTVVRTTVERETTGGLHATVDDYLVNLHVAEQCTNDATTNNRQ